MLVAKFYFKELVKFYYFLKIQYSGFYFVFAKFQGWKRYFNHVQSIKIAFKNGDEVFIFLKSISKLR